MPSKIILDPAEPGISEVVAGAAVGEPLVLRNVTIIPTSVSDASIEADIAEVTLDEEIPMAEGHGPEAAEGEDITKGMPMTNPGGFDEGGM